MKRRNSSEKQKLLQKEKQEEEKKKEFKTQKTETKLQCKSKFFIIAI
jgi:hypothetical protein